MTTAADIEALGIQVPKTRLKEWQKLQNAHFMTKARMMRVPVLADEIIDELLAVIERLVEQAKSDETIIATLRDMEIEATERAERATLSSEYGHMTEAFKQATKDRDHEHNKLMDTARDLAAAREERDELLLEAYHYGGFGGLYSAEYEDWLKELRQRIDLARYQPGGES